MTTLFVCYELLRSACASYLSNAVSRPVHHMTLPASKSRNPHNAKAHPGRKPDNEATAAGCLAQSVSSKGNSEKENIPGIRRIWTIMQSATLSTLSATLKKLTTIGSKLSMKRSRPGMLLGNQPTGSLMRKFCNR